MPVTIHNIYPTAPIVEKHGPFVRFNWDAYGEDYYYIHGSNVKGIPQLWRLHACFIQIYTDATVANRTVIVRRYIDDKSLSNSKPVDELIGANVPASTVGNFRINSLKYILGTTNTPSDVFNADNMLINGPDESLRFYVGLGKAGDTFRAHLILEYMNRHYGLPTPYDPDGQGG